MSDGTVQLINYAVWALSIGILGWLLIDALRVETTYDRELLVSSVEGEIEKEILGHHDEPGEGEGA